MGECQYNEDEMNERQQAFMAKIEDMHTGTLTQEELHRLEAEAAAVGMTICAESCHSLVDRDERYMIVKVLYDPRITAS